MANHKIVFFGTPDIVLSVVDFLYKTGDLAAVVTTPGDSPVKKYCLENNINLVSLEDLANLESDLFIVAAYGKILPKEILDLPKYGSINIHPSLLPKYRGPSPIQNTLLNGDKTSGVTIIKMDEKMDHGPIIAQDRLDLLDSDNYHTLGTKLFQLSIPLLNDVLAKIFNENIPEAVQDESVATFVKFVKKEDGLFDIDSPPSLEVLDKMVRAYYPWPGVWTKWNNKIIKFFPDKKIQMEGKTITDYKSFLNGYPTFPLAPLLK